MRDLGKGDRGSGGGHRGPWEKIYRLVFRLSFPSSYPERLRDEAVRTFAEARIRAHSREGPVAAHRYAAAASMRAAVDGLAERVDVVSDLLADLTSGWRADLRFALRQLLRHPLPAGVAILSLAAGIGANTLLFSAVDSTLLAPLPVPAPERVVRIFGPDARTTLRSAMSSEALEHLDRQAPALEGAAGTARLEAGLELGGDVRLASVEMVTPGYFEVLGVPPVRGRGFRPGEAETGAGRAAVLSHRLWSDIGGGDPDLIGGNLRLNRESFAVVGVAPEGFGGSNFTRGTDVWIATGARSVLETGPRGERASWLAGIGRLRPGATVEEATADVERTMAELHRRHSDSYASSGYFVTEERAGLVNPAQPGLVPLAAAVALAAAFLVLLVACLNVAGLALARVASRREEMGVRLALGAGRARLARQMFVETAVLAAPAAAAGLWGATAADRVFVGLIPPLSRLDVSFALDRRMLFFTAAVALASVLLAGILPALLATRGGIAALIGGRGERGPGTGGGLRGLVTLQITFSAAVLVLGGLFLQTLDWYRSAEPGYAVSDRVAVTLDVGLHGLPEDEGRQFYRALVREAEALPSVRRAALGRGIASGGPALKLERDDGDDLRVDTHVVGPGYFETLDIGLTSGRGFDDRDREGSEPVAVVNRTLAGRLAPGGGSPVDRLLETRSGRAYRIVGVARDVKYGSLAEGPRPFAYLPAAQHYRNRMTLLLAAPGHGAAVVAELRDVVERLRPGLPVIEARTLEAFVREDRLLARAAAAIGGGLGALSLFLAAVGLYGTLAFMVRRRRPELAIRMAVGAEPGRLFRDVLARGMRPVAWGLALSVPVAMLAALALRDLLIGTAPLDPRVFAAVAAILGVVAVLVLLGPARAAASLDALDALKNE